MMSSYGTSSPVSVDTRFWRMRVLVLASSWWKRTSFCETALNSLMGTLTSPKLMAPLQIDRGTRPVSRLLWTKSGALPRQMPTEPLARFFANDLTRVLVLAQALEGRMTEGAVSRPLAELDFTHQFGLDEDRVLQPGEVDERAALPPQRLQQLADVPQH